MTAANFRALATNYYGQGAHGVSTYNFFPEELAVPAGYRESELHERYVREQATALREPHGDKASASGPTPRRSSSVPSIRCRLTRASR